MYTEWKCVFFCEERKGFFLKISEEITKKFGCEVPVLVKTADAIAKILAVFPFERAKKEESYCMLLATPPKREFIEAIRLQKRL
ncbi:DUF1697 domain-containing protein [Aequorivita lipolytica]|uniref:DUF1697 domain-containing protein n=1 Tax=Aequorivita lipolytica TaxID=153267 RepID=A0A5C6YU75_9FLAO|nr:DUF1697 domain-containing protein [Aequorivita lipolytica]